MTNLVTVDNSDGGNKANTYCWSSFCFSLEVKFKNLFRTNVHMRRHRAGGSATTFPMPWQQLLAELQNLDAKQSSGEAPDVPKVGADLVHVVQVLLKTNDSDDKDALGGSYTRHA